MRWTVADSWRTSASRSATWRCCLTSVSAGDPGRTCSAILPNDNTSAIFLALFCNTYEHISGSLTFERFSSYSKHTNDDKIAVFPLFLRTAAADWYDQLPEDIRANMEQLETAFAERFTPSDFTKWTKVSEMFSRFQSFRLPWVSHEIKVASADRLTASCKPLEL